MNTGHIILVPTPDKLNEINEFLLGYWGNDVWNIRDDVRPLPVKNDGALRAEEVSAVFPARAFP